MWDIYSTDEYEEWFKLLDKDSMEAVYERVKLLKEFGPQLARPYADVLHGSKYKNLKELRAQTNAHVIRVAFCFDTQRKGFLITAGDKKGKNEKKFYKDLIDTAEQLIEKYNIRS